MIPEFWQLYCRLRYFFKKNKKTLTYYRNDTIIKTTRDSIILIITKGGNFHEYQVQKI